MTGLISFLLLGCYSAATASGPASFTDGCGSECVGTCFGGKCLYDFDVDGVGNIPDGEASRDMQPQLGFQSSAVLENKAQELSYELHRAEAHAALLQAQNGALQQQLERWRETGTNIAQREAQVASLLAASSSDVNAASATNSTAALPGADGAAHAAPSMLQQTMQHLWLRGPDVSHGPLWNFIVTVCFFVVMACALKMWCVMQSVRKGETSISQALACHPSSQRLQPVLRAMGLAQHKVEVSEIHLGSLFAGSSDVRVNFRMGNGQERRTKVLKNSEGTFLRFDDVLELSVCSSDAPCTIYITDRHGELAHVELPASEVVRLATRPHQEYFRTELTASSVVGDTTDQRPYVAMRMRNIIAIPTARLLDNKAAAKLRAYGSLAV